LPLLGWKHFAPLILTIKHHIANQLRADIT
jgi:hypothetical protein